MFHSSFFLTITSMCLMLMGSVAQASNLTIAYSGEVTSFSNVPSLGLSIGDTFSGAYTLDTDTPDQRPKDLTLGIFDGALVALTSAVGSYSFSAVEPLPSDVQNVQTGDDFPGSGDYYFIQIIDHGLTGAITGDPVDGRVPTDYTLQLHDPTGVARDTDALPTAEEPLDPADFPGGTFIQIVFRNPLDLDDTGVINASLTTHGVGPSIGGTIIGSEFGITATCLNITQPSLASVPLGGATNWDCEAAGLTVVPNDLILQQSIGIVTGSAAIGGSITGATGIFAGCHNRTTDQKVTTLLGGDTSWDCTALGLVASPRDQISTVSVGRAN